MALKDALIDAGPCGIDPMAAGATTPFGAALIRSAAGVVKGAKDDNSSGVIGFSVQPANNVVLDKDGFYQSTNDAGDPDVVRVVRGGAKINALVIAKANTSIENGDFLECAPIGSAANYLGVLNEAGSNAGGTLVTTARAQALEDCTITSASYKTPASDVAIGDSTITMTGTDIATMGLVEGDYIILEDVNGAGSWNRVKSLTATVITLQFPAVSALVANDNDFVYRVFQVKARVL